MLDELAQVRQQGYAASHGERLLGVTAISAPTVDARDEVRYRLSIGGPTVRMQTNEKDFIKRGRNAAADISRQFGGKQD